MSRPHYTIRNLTAVPLKVKLVERYKALASHDVGHLGILGRNFTSLGLSGRSEASASHLATTSESFFHRDLDIHIDPFTTSSIDVKPPDPSIGEVVRLTLEASDQRYRLDTPSTKPGSQNLTPLSPQPLHEFTAIFLPTTTFLAIYSSAQLHRWMAHLSPATPLSALSIPGTHNTPTYHKALPSVRCQAVNPRVQLDNGVRFFDIRLQPESPTSPKLALVHAVFPVSLTGPKYFRDLLTRVFAFLDENPTETLIMSLKREGVGSVTDQQLGRILYDHYTEGAEAHRWYTDPRVPTLGEVRGKIVLMRRFCIDELVAKAHEGRGWAVDAQSWADNTAHDVHGAVCVQDFYEVQETENIDKKIGFCEAQMERAAECVAMLPGITTDAVNPVPPQPFHLNFLSASNFWKVGCWPHRIAAILNPVMVDWLCRRHAADTVGDGGTGIVVCDWVGVDGDWDLVRCIVGYNSKLMMREMSLE